MTATCHLNTTYNITFSAQKSQTKTGNLRCCLPGSGFFSNYLVKYKIKLNCQTISAIRLNIVYDSILATNHLFLVAKFGS